MMNNIDRMVSHMWVHGGGTFLPPNYVPIAKTAKVYCLSLDDDRGVRINSADFTGTDLTVWLLNGNEEYIEQWNRRATNYGSLKAVGLWIDDGWVYVDVATIFPKDEYTLEVSLEIARTNNQMAVWDNELQVAIETGLGVR